MSSTGDPQDLLWRRQSGGLRNRIIHEYEWIEDERIFSIATDSVP